MPTPETSCIPHAATYKEAEESSKKFSNAFLRREQMSTDTAVDFLIAFLVIMVVALQAQGLQLKKGLRDLPGEVPKN